MSGEIKKAGAKAVLNRRAKPTGRNSMGPMWALLTQIARDISEHRKKQRHSGSPKERKPAWGIGLMSCRVCCGPDPKVSNMTPAEQIEALHIRIMRYERLLSDIAWTNFGLEPVPHESDVEEIWLRNELAMLRERISKLQQGD